jgi:hypothetical protein
MLVISTYEHLSPFGAPSLSPHDQQPRMADFRGFMPISSLARRIVAQEWRLSRSLEGPDAKRAVDVRRRSDHAKA